MGQSPSSETCRNDSRNTYWNTNASAPQQSLVNADLLNAFLAYAIVGGIASVLNVVCILTFLTKAELRRKYLFYALLAFGNLLNTLFMFLAGTIRREVIFANKFMQVRSSFDCLQQPMPHLQLLGGQLPAVVILIINIERFIAVYRPVYYKVNVKHKTRLGVVFCCIGTVIVSLIMGYVFAYFSTYCSNYFCSITSVYRFNYSNYNTAIIIIFPFLALIFNICAYVGARTKLINIASFRKEMRRILFALAITSVDVLLIAFPNILIWGAFMGFITWSQATLAYLYVLFCCNSAADLFVYIFLKRDFRNHLLISISFGALRPYLEESNVAAGNIPGAPKGMAVGPLTNTNSNSNAQI